VEADEEDELRGFCNLVARRAGDAHGEIAWALGRFEMGCEREHPFETLTDHLLALRALLEPEGPGSGRLAQRLAAICATPERQAALAERTAHAISLERGLIAGLRPAVSDTGALIADTSHHLRALLRDVLCGHLDPDLVGVADGILEAGVAGEAEEAEAPIEETLTEPPEPEPDPLDVQWLEPDAPEPADEPERETASTPAVEPQTVFFDELDF
jgi:hypothetical protein